MSTGDDAGAGIVADAAELVPVAFDIMVQYLVAQMSFDGIVALRVRRTQRASSNTPP